MLSVGDRVYCQHHDGLWLKGDHDDRGTVVGVGPSRASVFWDDGESADDVSAETGMCKDYPYRARRAPRSMLTERDDEMRAAHLAEVASE